MEPGAGGGAGSEGVVGTEYQPEAGSWDQAWESECLAHRLCIGLSTLPPVGRVTLSQ